MSEYLSKKAVLEWLDDRRYKSPWIESFREHLESGAFDAPEMEHINTYWARAREGLIKRQEAEVQRLRTALEFYTDSRKYLISEKYSGGEFIGSWAEICGDSGNVARRALKEG